MMLLSHVLAGAVIGVKVESPIAIALTGFLSHFILDFIPHWNFARPRKIHFNEFFRIWPDLIASTLIYAVFLLVFANQWKLITLGVFSAILPDLLSLLDNTKLAKTTFKWFYNLHERVQHEIHIVPGIAVQVFFILIILWWLII